MLEAAQAEVKAEAAALEGRAAAVAEAEGRADAETAELRARLEAVEAEEEAMRKRSQEASDLGEQLSRQLAAREVRSALCGELLL